jgi:3-hydroxyisobutyrate dehydrogenase-like beta-hydroxyacid dehydrogenase
LHEAGAAVLGSLEALRDLEVDTVFTNVSDSDALRAVIMGTHGLASVLPPGTTVIDNSSVHPQTAREIGEVLSQRGIAFLDAPVTGGTSGARAGTLTVMVGGDPAVLQRGEPLLRAFASSIYHVGPVGSGQACKLCNQVAAACAMLGLCEGLALAARANLPVKTVLDVLSSGTAGSPIVKNQGPKIIAGDMTPGFRVDLMRKDLAAAAGFAKTLALPLPGSEIVAQMLSALSAAGDGALGWQALIRQFVGPDGVTARPEM